MPLKLIKPTPQLAFGLIAVTCILLFFIPAVLALPGWEFFNLSEDKTAHIGDAIGGITAPFVAILAAALTFLAFWVQYDFNEKQQASIEKQRFEHNFYEMLNIHESITQSLKMEIADESADVESSSRIIAKRKGRDVFQLLYEVMPIFANTGAVNGIIIFNTQQYKGLRELFAKREEDRLTIYERNSEVGKLDHYFRQLYNIFRMIVEDKKLTDLEKYEYARIVRSTLSQYELVILFYNCLSSQGVDKFKPLIQDFSVMNNLRKTLLAKAEDEDLYEPKAYGKNYKDCL